MGRSRGGLTSKFHALVDAEGRPVNLRLIGGQIADGAEADALTDELGEGTSCWPTRVMTRMPFGPRPPSERPGPTSRRRVIARALSCFRAGLSIGNAISWNGSSTGSSSSGHRNPIWQAPGKLPRRRKARRNKNMVPKFMSRHRRSRRRWGGSRLEQLTRLTQQGSPRNSTGDAAGMIRTLKMDLQTMSRS